MTKQSDELKQIIKDAHELDAKTAAQVLVVVDNSLESFEEQIEEFRKQIRETNATVLKRILDTDASILKLADSLSQYRLERNTSEVEKAKKDLEIAERRAVLSTQEKLVLKEVVGDELKIKAELEAAEKKRKRHEFWAKVAPSVMTALILTFVVPISLALVAAIIIFLASVFQIQIPVP